MTIAVRTRWPAVLLAGVLSIALSACSGDPDEPAPTSPVVATESETPVPTDTPTDEPTTEPTDDQSEEPTAASTDMTTPVQTESAPEPESTDDAPTSGGPTDDGTGGSQPGGAPTEGAGAAALATIMPEGFPLPEDLTIQGDPTATADNWNASFTVPSPVDTFDFYLRELPEAGYELQPGTSDRYSPEVNSGAILARSETHDVNLLMVDDEVEITITTR